MSALVTCNGCKRDFPPSELVLLNKPRNSRGGRYYYCKNCA